MLIHAALAELNDTLLDDSKQFKMLSASSRGELGMPYNVILPYYPLTQNHLDALQHLIAQWPVAVDPTQIAPLLTTLMQKISCNLVYCTKPTLQHFCGGIITERHTITFLEGCLIIWSRLDAETQEQMWDTWQEIDAVFDAEHTQTVWPALQTATDQPYYATLIRWSIAPNPHQLLESLLEIRHMGVINGLAHWHNTHTDISPITDCILQIPTDHSMRDNYQHWITHLLNRSTELFIPSEYLIKYLALTNTTLETCSHYWLKTLQEHTAVLFHPDSLSAEHVHTIYQHLAAMPRIDAFSPHITRYISAIYALLSRLTTYAVTAPHDPYLFYIAQQIAYQTQHWQAGTFYRDIKNARTFGQCVMQYCSDTTHAIPSPPVPESHCTLYKTQYERYIMFLRSYYPSDVPSSVILNVLTTAVEWLPPDFWEEGKSFYRLYTSHRVIALHAIETQHITCSLPLLLCFHGMLIVSLQGYYRPSDYEAEQFQRICQNQHPATGWRPNPQNYLHSCDFAQDITDAWNLYQSIIATPEHAALLETHFTAPNRSEKQTQFLDERAAKRLAAYTDSQQMLLKHLTQYEQYLENPLAHTAALLEVQNQLTRQLTQNSALLLWLSDKNATIPFPNCAHILMPLLAQMDLFRDNQDAIRQIIIFTRSVISTHLKRHATRSYTLPGTDRAITDPSTQGQLLQKLSQAAHHHTQYLLIKEAYEQYSVLRKQLTEEVPHTVWDCIVSSFNPFLRDYFGTVDPDFLVVWTTYQEKCTIFSTVILNETIAPSSTPSRLQRTLQLFRRDNTHPTTQHKPTHPTLQFPL